MPAAFENIHLLVLNKNYFQIKLKITLNLVDVNTYKGYRGHCY